eukprot:TRINITY_DN5532_c0_g1_i3.p1 TRINITY_DN5532_c0_g1~~TRINITY_DN5532_c0_g1_i3.p1  ORF type:complete len:573 (-),score=220.13 TRINITY_DN5532_c0_g1_i3:94-1812(-)
MSKNKDGASSSSSNNAEGGSVKKTFFGSQLEELLAISKATQKSLQEFRSEFNGNSDRSPQFSSSELEFLSKVETGTSDDFEVKQGDLMSVQLEKQVLYDGNDNKIKGKLSFDGFNQSRKTSISIDFFKRINGEKSSDIQFSYQKAGSKRLDLFIYLNNSSVSLDVFQLGGDAIAFKLENKSSRKMLRPFKLIFELTEEGNNDTIATVSKTLEVRAALSSKLQKVHMYPCQGDEGTQVRLYQARSEDTTYAVLFDGKKVPFSYKGLDISFKVPPQDSSSSPSSVILVRRKGSLEVQYYRCWFYYTSSFVPTVWPEKQRENVKKAVQEEEIVKKELGKTEVKEDEPSAREERSPTRPSKEERAEIPCHYEEKFGNCTRVRCDYLHKNNPNPRTVCLYFSKGNCKNGDNCSYIHDVTSSPAVGKESNGYRRDDRNEERREDRRERREERRDDRREYKREDRRDDRNEERRDNRREERRDDRREEGYSSPAPRSENLNWRESSGGDRGSSSPFISFNRKNNEERGKKQFCKFLKTQGRCDYGDNCKFSHSESSSSSSSNQKPTKQYVPVKAAEEKE